MIRIGLVQADSGTDVAKNLDILSRYAVQGAAAGCCAICFPECFLTGYAPEAAENLALHEDAYELRAVSELARVHGLDLLVGYMERHSDGRFISHAVFRPDGTRSVYRKTHLGENERRYVSPGDRLEVFSLTCGVKIGIQLCVEAHFPDITQTLALRGADVVFAPHAVPRAAGERERIWGKYIPARAYDNRVYLACCNRWDETRYGGGCLVVDPRGETVAASFENCPLLLTCEVDEQLPALFRTNGGKRSARYYAQKRRKELYE